LVENIVVKIDKIIPIYLDFYKTIIENEIELAKISVEDKILHIGCGPVPATAIYIVKKTNADITAIDKNLKLIKKAQTLILKQKLSNKIHIIHANALNFPLEKFNLIIVSLGIEPYEKVLRYISQNMRDDARLIVRTSSSIDSNLVEKDFFLKNIFTFKKIIPQKKNGLLISVLLFKK
jgi:ubiquinone/menaquinone biosynthesis C-methylase UbiE